MSLSPDQIAGMVGGITLHVNALAAEVERLTAEVERLRRLIAELYDCETSS